MSKKKKYEVKENETVSDCLDRMKADGYVPTRRMEKPVFKEVKKNGKVIQEPYRQQIIFEAKLMEK
ncbi:NETI motif-containing protein [Bacillus tianshenii]|nr:NETI motif-containing protein [Bacillus tianshenii]